MAATHLRSYHLISAQVRNNIRFGVFYFNLSKEENVKANLTPYLSQLWCHWQCLQMETSSYVNKMISNPNHQQVPDSYQCHLLRKELAEREINNLAKVFFNN